MRLGYKLMAEGFGPKELIRQAVRAEPAGFGFFAKELRDDLRG